MATALSSSSTSGGSSSRSQAYNAAHPSRSHNGYHHPVPYSSAEPSSTRTETKLVPITDGLLGSFYVDKKFVEPDVAVDSSVTSLCFDDRGDALVSGGNDEKILIFSMSSGKLSKTHYSKKYGVDLVRFTHDKGAILHASTKVDHAIRHHSLYDNKYLRYFQGHRARVSALQMSPVDETFLSAAVNESVRMWDLRAANAQACMPVNGHAMLAYDPSGTIFALAFNESNVVLLYDLRRWYETPFKTLTLNIDSASSHSQSGPVITSITFDPTGSKILVGTSGAAHFILDAYSGATLYRLSGRAVLAMQNLRGMEERDPAAHQSPTVEEAGVSGQECGWTPDGRRVYSGAGRGDIVFWTLPSQEGDPRQQPTVDLSPTTQLDGHPGQAIRTVVFNPRSAMMASAGDQVALWLPDAEKDNERQ